MRPLTAPFSPRRWLLGLLAALLLTSAARLAADEAESELRLMVILTRHGVRSPLMSNDQLDKFSAQPWPVWPVAPGVLTRHGHQQMVLMGDYYRAYCLAQGVLTGQLEADRARIYFQADNDQRTLESAQALAASLVPGLPLEIAAVPAGKSDPLFRPAQLPVGNPDRTLGVAAVLGRVGGDPARVVQANRSAFVALQQVLYGGDGTPPAGLTPLLDLPSAVLPGKRDHTVELSGSLSLALSITDNLLLEYAEGLPMKDVGWGRLTPAGLTQLLELHAIAFDLIAGTSYPAKVQGSNLADHLLRTIDQAATGRAGAGAFGTTQHRLVVLVGHDTNLVNLGGLLGLHWWLPGTPENPVLPGGALVFELRQHRGDGRYTVSASYVSQSLEQIRTLQPLTLKNPPDTSPIYIPGCSTAGPRFEAPLDRFEAVLRQAIDPQFVLPDPS